VGKLGKLRVPLAEMVVGVFVAPRALHVDGTPTQGLHSLASTLIYISQARGLEFENFQPRHGVG